MKNNFKTEQEYIEAIAPFAQKACKRYGYLPSVLIAQSCLENGYGIPSYWDNQEIKYLLKYNNMVGQKAKLLTSSWYDKSVWPGKSFSKNTPEVYSNKQIIKEDNFRIFDDIEQSFCDFILFLLYASNYGYNGKPKYGAEVVNIKNPNTLIKEVGNRGYATGPTYPSSVIKIINKHNLTKYDDLSLVTASNYIPNILKDLYIKERDKQMAKIKGIDISYYQGTIDFKKVAADGVKFAVIREGYRKTIDSKFLEYVKGCQKNNINIMVYHFIYTDNATIKQNAESTYNNIKKAGLDPTKTWIAADLEYDTWKKNKETCTKTKCTKYTKDYLEALKALGCKKLFIYANTDYYKNYYDWTKLSEYPIWLADYSGNPDYPCVMQQYGSTGRVNGINGNVDMDWLFDNSMLTTSVTTTNKATTTTTTTTTTKTGITANDVIKVMRGWIGLSRSAGTHKVIIDTYNNHKPLARGYKVTYRDAFCDTTVSAAFIKLNAVNLIGGTECGVENHVALFKKAGIWEENGNITPKPGYIIVYNWNDSTQPNDGYSDHIGIVESVVNGKITTIEGNINGGLVGRRTIPVGWGYIRGYAKPKYGTTTTTTTTAAKVTTPTNSTIDYAEKLDKKLSGTYITTSAVNLRTGAGTSKNIILKMPKNSTVNNYGYYTEKNNVKWLYVIYDNKKGFVNIKYLKKNEKINQQTQVQKLIKAAKNLNTEMQKDIKAGVKWTYTNKLSMSSTFQLARTDKKYRTNCVLGVQWAIQEAKILTNARGWYGKNDGTISWGSSKDTILSKFEDINIGAKKTVNQLLSEGILKPGDILTYVDMNHTNLYLGNNEWFDSGHAYCSETGENAAFKKWVGALVYGQKQVGHILRLKSISNIAAPINTNTTTTSNKLNETPKYSGKVIAAALNVRSYAGTEYANIKSHPYLKKDDIVEICDTIKDKNNKDWHFIRINKTIFGFVSATYIQKI